jgi:hypothetical protein
MKPKQRGVVIKNTAAAPFVYFDGVPSCGMLAGTIELELAARVVVPQLDGNVSVDAICVAHLRCSATAASMLRDSIERALDMFETQHQVEMEAQDARKQ